MQLHRLHIRSHRLYIITATEVPRAAALVPTNGRTSSTCLRTISKYDRTSRRAATESLRSAAIDRISSLVTILSLPHGVSRPTVSLTPDQGVIGIYNIESRTQLIV